MHKLMELFILSFSHALLFVLLLCSYGNWQLILAKFVKAGQLRLTDKKPAAPDFLLDFAGGSFYTHQSVGGWAGFVAWLWSRVADPDP